MGTREDVDGDGRLDLVLKFSTAALGFSMTSKQACLTGPLSNGESFLSCDSVRPQ